LPRRRPALPVEVVPVLIAIAILGYVAGHSSGKGASRQGPAQKGADVALGYPAGWRMAETAPGIPQLSVANVVVLGPNGDARRAGLMLGSLPSGELAPLPKRFVATLHSVPTPQIVNLVETQAYRYSQLSVPGYDKRLTLFVIPNPGKRPKLFACYAAPGRSAEMRECEASLATASSFGQPQAYELAPEPRYARAIRATVSTLDALRAALKRELSPDVTASSARRLATELAEGFATAAAALDRLHPSVVAEPVHGALADAARRAHDGYVALATAIGERDVTRYRAAQKAVTRAEADVDAALGSFLLLGYSATAQPARGAEPGTGS
jgi:hypothetical protein